MNFSLKFFVGLVLLLGVAAGLISRKIRVSKPLSVPMSYDVIDAKDRIETNYPAPTEMILWRKPNLYRDLRRQAVSELPASKEELLRGFLADPSTYTSYEDEHQKIVLENRDSVLAGTERWLKPASPHLLNVSLMRAIHDDRKGFDILKQQRIDKPETGPIALLRKFPDEWWQDDQPFRAAMHRMLEIDSVRKEPSSMHLNRSAKSNLG